MTALKKIDWRGVLVAFGVLLIWLGLGLAYLGDKSVHGDNTVVYQIIDTPHPSRLKMMCINEVVYYSTSNQLTPAYYADGVLRTCRINDPIYVRVISDE
jgi:hypothetical protein